MFKRYIKNIKIFLQITRICWRNYRYTLKRYFKIVDYYAKHISERKYLQKPIPNAFITPPHDRALYPFDAEIAAQAMIEIGEELKKL